MVKFYGGIPVQVNNSCSDTTNENGFSAHISYLRYDSNYGSDTTALVVQYGNCFEDYLILNGDHRSKYRGLCLDDKVRYFDDTPYKNKMSDSSKQYHKYRKLEV